MKNLTLTPNAIEDLNYWAKKNPKILKHIFKLFKDISKHPNEGIGKPEQLKFDLKGCWSRRISLEHRVVYRIMKDEIQILACRYHYK
ncbi:MAG: Txe/YoeB family addiction module toxin [Candidatus Cloacimonetes bacterium]|nr:Txe/YoeB family addiction module toxin [Candidatus Cloacimonadota bacterium]